METISEVRTGSIKEFYTLMGKIYNKEFSKEELLELTLNNKDVAEVLANNLDTPTDILDIYSTDENWRVRCHVALNKNTSTETLCNMRKTETNLLIKTAICQELDIRDI